MPYPDDFDRQAAKDLAEITAMYERLLTQVELRHREELYKMMNRLHSKEEYVTFLEQYIVEFISR